MLDTDRSERAALVASVIAMVVCAVPLARVMGAAWEGGGLARELLQLRWLVGADIAALSVGSLGVFLALLTLMTADPKKRVQGVLLWASVAVAMAGLVSRGVFLRPGADAADLVAVFPWFAAGYLSGFLLGGGRRLVENRTTDALEFRRASTGVFAFVAALVAAAVLEYHLSYPLPVDVRPAGVFLVSADESFGVRAAGAAGNALAAGVFLAVGRRFVRYDAGEAFLVLGPRGSGKSLLLLGAFLEARERSAERDTATPMDPSPDLVELADGATSGREWFVESTGQDELGEFAFSYVRGSLFPTNVRLSTLDYAGELLPRVSNALGAPTDEPDERLSRLAAETRAADTLVLLVDAERFVAGDSLDIEPYFDVLREAPDAKDVLVVATKADYLADDFRAARDERAARSSEAFSEYVEARLRNGSEQVATLLAEAADADVLPVYYRTETTEAGERVPAGDGTPSTVGFDALLDRLGEGR